MAGHTGRAARPASTPVESGHGRDVAVPRRQVRSGPLVLRPIDEASDRPGLETRLPLLILLGLGVLVGVQVYLAF